MHQTHISSLTSQVLRTHHIMLNVNKFIPYGFFESNYILA